MDMMLTGGNLYYGKAPSGQGQGNFQTVFLSNFQFGRIFQWDYSGFLPVSRKISEFLPPGAPKKSIALIVLLEPFEL